MLKHPCKHVILPCKVCHGMFLFFAPYRILIAYHTARDDRLSRYGSHDVIKPEQAPHLRTLKRPPIHTKTVHLSFLI